MKKKIVNKRSSIYKIKNEVYKHNINQNIKNKKIKIN